jgi:alpha-ribazole phosphatase
MQLTLIRHTSVDCPKGICYGITDVPVASSFRNELEIVKQNLGDQHFDAVYSSPLKRCTILAAELANELPVKTDGRITELNFGDWEMSSWDNIFESATGKNWFAGYSTTACPNGESFADQIERTQSFLSDLKKNRFGKVLIISHAGILRAMMCLLQAKTPEEAFGIPVENGQILTFNLDNPEQ